MEDRIYNVLFICTGNSARSIMAEALLNELGAGRFKAFSAGSHPAGFVNPLALEVLGRMRLPTVGHTSKSWGDFARPESPKLDFVFTVCDSAAGEVCPVWPGQPLTAHWGVPDPVTYDGPDEKKKQVFYDTALTLRRRIELLLALPIGRLDAPSLQHEVTSIGRQNYTPAPINILVLCTHNSARSVLAEGMINRLAEQLNIAVRGFSAGSTPSGTINPFALKVLSAAGVAVAGFRSKSWNVFAWDDAPRMRIVITVCDQAAAEMCPYWPGAPVQAHWGYPDPSNVIGSEAEVEAAFEVTRQALGFRILQLLLMPLEAMSDAELRDALKRIAAS